MKKYMLEIICFLMCFLGVSSLGFTQHIKLQANDSKEPIEIEQEIVNLMPSIKAMIEDLGGWEAAKEQIIPLPVELKTLQALIEALKLALKLTENKSPPFSLNTMKSVIRKAFENLKEPFDVSSVEKFLLVSNFLDINIFIKPAAALWFDLNNAAKPIKDLEELNKLVVQLPEDIRKLVISHAEILFGRHERLIRAFPKFNLDS